MMSSFGKPLKIYNASAGSGKTFTLVQEYLRIVLKDKNTSKFRSILAMTFTNKAANEMKERIIQALIDLKTPPHLKTLKQNDFLLQTAKNLQINPKIIEERAFLVLNNILHDYSSFSVLTIDKFTHKIIRTFAKDLNISVDFDVELNENKLRKDVTDLLIDQIGRNNELSQLMYNYAEDNLKEDKSWNFSNQVYEFCSHLFKENAYKSILKLQKFKDNDFLKVKNELIKEISIFENTLVEIAKIAVEIIETNQLTHDDFVEKSRGVFNYFIKISLKNFEKASDKIQTNVLDNLWAHKQSKNKEVVESIQSDLSKLYHQIFNFLENYNPQYLLNKEILKNVNNLSLLNHLLHIIEQKKEEDNILLISDFYKKISEIIVNEPVPFIYERLGVRYAHFLLDEFQDTSQLQWINIIPLVHNSVSFGFENLIVGDGKQAIYRWRNGDVEQFTQLPDKIINPDHIESLQEAEILFKQMGEKVILKENYRSAKEIVEFNNSIFSHLSLKLGNYLKYIYDDLKQKPTKLFKGYVETHFSDDLNDEAQLNYIKNSIDRSIERGFNFNDICIIVRNNNMGVEIAKFLTQKKLPVLSSESLLIGNDTSVKLLINIMKSFSNSQNVNYRIKSAEHWSILKYYDTTKFISENESFLKTETIQSFFFKENISLLTPHEFHNLYDFTEHLIQVFDIEVSKNSFIQFFLENVFQFVTSNSSSLADFLFWYDEVGYKKSIIIPEGANAIRIMTIHKSKGLQFPVVICPFFDWKSDLHKQISWINDEREKLPAYFLNMKKEMKETKHKLLYELEHDKLILDDLNLLYVAFTRPEKALFISFNSKTNTVSKDWLKNYFEGSNLFTTNGMTYSCGNFNELIHDEKEKDNKEFSISYPKQVMNKPEFSFKSEKNSKYVFELNNKRNFGIHIHQILSKVYKRDDINISVNNYVIKNNINNNLKEELYQYIKLLFTNLNFSFYFDHEKVKNEVEIINSKEEKLIPDKIIFENDFTLIVDFKTGQKTEKNRKQMLNYISILKEMNYPNVKGEIFYTETIEIEKV